MEARSQSIPGVQKTLTAAVALAMLALGWPSRAAAQTFQEFPVDVSPQAITAGPYGALWFTENVGNKIGRITTAGVVCGRTFAGRSAELIEPAAVRMSARRH